MPFIGFPSSSHTHDIVPYLAPGVTNRGIVQTVTLVEVLSRTKYEYKLIAPGPNTVTVSDGLGFHVFRPRAISQTIVHAPDLLSRQHIIPKTIHETITIPDNFGFVPEDFEGEDFEMGTFLTRSVILHREFTELAIIVHTTINGAAAFAPFLSETITVTDNMDRQMLFSRELADEIIALTEEQLQYGRVKAIELSEIVGLAEDTLERIATLLREIADAPDIAVNEAIDTLKTGFLSKHISEIIGPVLDETTRQLLQTREVPEEVLMQSDEATTASVKTQTIDEVAIEVSDQLERLASKTTEILEEVTVDDTELARLLLSVRAVTDELSALTDLTEGNSIRGLVLDEIISIDDLTQRVSTQLREIAAQAIVVDDAEIHKIRKVLQEIIEDPIPVTDLVDKVIVIQIGTIETMTVDEQLALQSSKARQITQVVAVLEQLGRIKNYINAQLIVAGSRVGAGGVAMQRYDFVLGDMKVYHKTGKNVITQKKVGGNVA